MAERHDVVFIIIVVVSLSKSNENQHKKRAIHSDSKKMKIAMLQQWHITTDLARLQEGEKTHKKGTEREERERAVVERGLYSEREREGGRVGLRSKGTF